MQLSSLSPHMVEADTNVVEAVKRGFVEIKSGRVLYNLNRKTSYDWSDPEEWVRCLTISYLVVEKGYPPNRMRTEVRVPRRTPNDFADVVVYSDDKCKEPYLVVENKSADQKEAERAQGIEQLFGNANSLRAPLGLYDEYTESRFYDVGNFPSLERTENRRGSRDAVPVQYGEVRKYTYIAGGTPDIEPATPRALENKIRRTHSIIWSGGKRDPLNAFGEWSKLLFAKVQDERRTENGEKRRFQVGTNETTAAVASRVHGLFEQACRVDSSIFPEGIRIDLSDRKIYDIVQVLQDISIMDTDVDTVGIAFESFFGSVFRGELGQYFTMRQLCRFTVAMLDISHNDYVIDPTAGSGGFLLEALLQVWHNVDAKFEGRHDLLRIKQDFAYDNVFGIEIHEVLARICKINLLLHHDGHTNVEANRSCLDSKFSRPRLNPYAGQFTRVVGNPPFGDTVEEGDEDLLGDNTLASFEVAAGRTQIPSEHAILERTVEMLADGGKLGLVLPDGVFNNQGELSNCPRVRRYLMENGVVEAIVSLPDFTFRKSGAQNKTSILFFRKFNGSEQAKFRYAYDEAIGRSEDEDAAVLAGLQALGHRTFLAEANHIGYSSTGAKSHRNDLYSGSIGGSLDADQAGTILGEYRRFESDPGAYDGAQQPDCMAMDAAEMWGAHESHRLDPKYFLFKQEERSVDPPGWITLKLSDVMERRLELARPEENPNVPVSVMTISQTGEIRQREAGKGKNPPEWLGMYFEDGSSTWYAARQGDVVFSSIDLWKGCIAVVPEEFDGALVTKEFPIYRVTDERLDPEFLSALLRSRYYMRAFRAITTGHSNRRRTQVADFEALEISFPESREEQRALANDIVRARRDQKEAANTLKEAMIRFSDVIDGRGNEEYQEVLDEEGAE